MMQFYDTGLFWLVMGIMLFVMEMAVPGFVLFFFGLGAWVTAGVLWLYPISIALQLAIFLVASLVSLAVFQKLFRGSLFAGNDLDDDIADEGDIGEVVEAIHPPKKGKIKLAGTFWQATADTSLAIGVTVRVVRRDGLVVHVEKEQ